MGPYVAIMGVFSMLALSVRSQRTLDGATRAALVLLAIILPIYVGLRFEIGSDWSRYLFHQERALGLSFWEAIAGAEPLYYRLNWLSAHVGFGIGGINFVCAALFTACLIAFVRRLPNPPLAIVYALPYLVFVVGMGYTRQAVAIGFVMLAIHAHIDGRFWKALLWIAVGTLFHKAALVMFPFILMAGVRNKFLIGVLVLGVMLGLFNALLADRFDQLRYIYIERQYDSSGAIIRVLMTAIPAAVFLALRSRIPMSLIEGELWRNFSLAALVCLLAVFLSPSTTVVDRIALFLSPLQLFIASWLPSIISRRTALNQFWVLAVIGYSAAVMVVWLNFAGHSEAWVPYKSYLFSA